MRVQVRCGNCQRDLLVAQQWAGKAVSCPSCRRSIAVPGTPQRGASQLATPQAGTLRSARRTGHGDPRKRQYAKWWILLGIWVAAGLLLPTFVATIRQGISRGVITGLGLAVFASPLLVLYGIGMIAYAATLFEWRIYTKSRKTRRGIKWLGEARYHKMQLYMWGFVMIAVSTIALVGTLVCSVALLFVSVEGANVTSTQSGPSYIKIEPGESLSAEEKAKLAETKANLFAAADQQIMSMSFDDLDRMRRNLEDDAERLQEARDEILKLDERIKEKPGDYGLRQWIARDVRKFTGQGGFEGAKKRYDDEVSKYKRLLAELKKKASSPEYNDRFTERHEADFPDISLSEACKLHASFPFLKVSTALGEYRYVALDANQVVRRNDFDEARTEPIVKKIEELEQFFKEMREKHGYQPDLDRSAVMVKEFRQRLSEANR